MKTTLTTQEDIRKRFKQIKEARQELYKKMSEGEEIKIVTPRKYLNVLGGHNISDHLLSSDNPKCGMKGFYSGRDKTTYYCPIEDCTEEELKNITFNI